MTGSPSALFWYSGARGELRIGWCPACACHRHPALEVCPECHGEVLPGQPITGRATVRALSENHQAWPGAPAPPYWLAIVALDAAPELRLTTRLTGLGDRTPAIGMAVEVRFEASGELWLPLFAPLADAVGEDPGPLASEGPPQTRLRIAPGLDKFERHAAITGVGASPIGRRLGRSATALAVEASRAAATDAGLSLAQIDGISHYPGSSGMPGVSSGGVRALEQALGLQPVWHSGAAEVPGQTGALLQAMLALAAGLCRHVLCVTSFSATQLPWTGAPGRCPDGELAWRQPFGAMMPLHWIALQASHYLQRYGVTREALGWIAVNARRQAADNPEALQREPLSLDAYLAAPPISTPFGRHDCDSPCDGAIAFVLSRRELAGDLRQPPILVEAAGSQIAEPQFWDQGALSHQVNTFGPARHLWSRSTLRPSEVDLACLYDGFSFNALCWLEALGFCAPGEAAAFVAGGRRIGRDGELPLNPHGGHLAAGRSNGYGQVREAVLQLRGQAGARQLARARVAVTSSGGGIPGGCLLLRRAD